MRRAGTEPKKILIVDPDCTALDPLVRLLDANNYIVAMTETVEDAWRSLSADPPDLVLLEPMLPSGTEGFHFVWELRDHPDEKLRRTPVLIVSRIHQTMALNLFPDFHDGHYQAHEYLPVQGFIDKPVDHNSLLRAVNSVFVPFQIRGPHARRTSFSAQR
ncbi:MAG: response regulator [Actinomycetota bacterium]|nr:response regulator [Actinomycetota bacterium]